MRAILVVPQCCGHCTPEENMANAEHYELTYQFGEFYTRTGRVMGRRQFACLRAEIAALGYPVWVETDDPATVRRVFGLAESDEAVRPEVA